MFDKLMNFLFKPDTEDDDDIQVVDENEKQEELISNHDFIKEEKVIVKKEVKEEKKVVPEVQQEYKEVVKAKTSLHIIADGPQEKENKSKKKTRTLKREEYDIQPVISPFYGVKGEVNTPKKTEKKATPVYKKETKKSEFSEVISPIYGIKEKKEEVKPIIKEEKKEEVKEIIVPLPTTAYETIEEENLALDDILSNKDGSNDDLIQFSLFGEDKRIQEDVFENEDMDNDDTLPF